MVDETDRPKYLDRYVAFVDVLGFSRLIEESNAESPIGRAGAALAMIQSWLMGSDIAREYGSSHGPRWRGYWASDALLMTAEGTSSGFRELVDQLLRLSGQLLYSHGLLLRGAITRGNVYESSLRQSLGALIFGPAIVRAVRLEKGSAIYPRIIFDPKMIDNHLAMHLGELRSRARVACDVDGLWYIDYVGAAPRWYVGGERLSEAENRRRWLHRIRAIACRRLQYHRDDTTLAPKYGWLARKHDDVVARYPELALRTVRR
jgi:hypothetical protein